MKHLKKFKNKLHECISGYFKNRSTVLMLMIDYLNNYINLLIWYLNSICEECGSIIYKDSDIETMSFGDLLRVEQLKKFMKLFYKYNIKSMFDDIEKHMIKNNTKLISKSELEKIMHYYDGTNLKIINDDADKYINMILEVKQKFPKH